MLKFVFFGTPDYVVPILESLHKNFRTRGESPIAAVVTQEPKLVGREQVKTYSAVDTWAYQHKKPIIFDPMEVVSKNILADVGILASFGKIIPDDVIKYFRYGIVNIHPSLLPLWRGSSPIQASIASGEKITGVTFMQLDPLLDHGPIISQFKDEILPTDDMISLRTRLFLRAAEAITTLIPAYISGKTKIKPQEHAKAVFTKQMKKEDGFIPPEILSQVIKGKTPRKNWEIRWMYKISQKLKTKSLNDKQEKIQITLKPTPETINNFIRAMNPWPGSWTYTRIKNRDLRIKILKAHVKETEKPKNSKTKKIMPSNFCLELDFVQLEGKSPVSWQQFREGYPDHNF